MNTKKLWVCRTAIYTEAWLVEVPVGTELDTIYDSNVMDHAPTVTYDHDPVYEIEPDLPGFDKGNYSAYDI